MSVIRFVGDVHGKIAPYLEIIRKADTEEISTFQVGDMGLGFRGIVLSRLGSRHRFIRGNHDDPAACRAHPSYAGDWGADRDLFYLGGAFSIDWAWRRAYMASGGEPVWWADEELSQDELDAAFELYRKAAPRIVMTHEAPASVSEELLLPMLLGSSQGGYFSAKLGRKHSRTAITLERMFNIHQPKYWVFGHYHVDWRREIHGTQFICLAELSTIDINGEE